MDVSLDPVISGAEIYEEDDFEKNASDSLHVRTHRCSLECVQENAENFRRTHRLFKLNYPCDVKAEGSVKMSWGDKQEGVKVEGHISTKIRDRSNGNYVEGSYKVYQDGKKELEVKAGNEGGRERSSK